jgi:hypothetical protein
VLLLAFVHIEKEVRMDDVPLLWSLNIRRRSSGGSDSDGAGTRVVTRVQSLRFSFPFNLRPAMFLRHDGLWWRVYKYHSVPPPNFFCHSLKHPLNSKSPTACVAIRLRRPKIRFGQRTHAPRPPQELNR